MTRFQVMTLKCRGGSVHANLPTKNGIEKPREKPAKFYQLIRGTSRSMLNERPVHP